jgi:hypothetical protein
LFGMTNHSRFIRAALVAGIAAGLATAALQARGEKAPERPADSWRTDAAWHEGKAEWALYDAVRSIYGVPRSYEATIFTNREHLDPATGTKTLDHRAAGAVAVFKHTVSEIIPTENYTYRFLTSLHVQATSPGVVGLTMSSQEDCGSTFKRFTVRGGRVRADSYCYFPGAGERHVEYDGEPEFHDAMLLTLRDRIADEIVPEARLTLVADQTDIHATEPRPDSATLRYLGKEDVTVPFGRLLTHHFRIEHAADGGVTQSDYWLAADPGLRHVAVRYRGPYGVEYRLKKLGWWAYWDGSQARPDQGGGG